MGSVTVYEAPPRCGQRPRGPLLFGMSKPGSTVLYDPRCPFCRMCKRLVRLLDRRGRLTFTDVASPEAASLLAPFYRPGRVKRTVVVRDDDGRALCVEAVDLYDPAYGFRDVLFTYPWSFYLVTEDECTSGRMAVTQILRIALRWKS